MNFFTDFEAVQPRIIEVATSALDARKVMMTTHVRLLLVVNHQNQFVGVITANDLIERKIVQRVSEGYRRDEIDVRDLMTPKKQLTGLNIAAVQKATISDINRVLKNVHQQHCLVIDHEHARIRGIFSASDISRTAQTVHRYRQSVRLQQGIRSDGLTQWRPYAVDADTHRVPGQTKAE